MTGVSNTVHSLNYSDQPVRESHILDLLNVAVWAPNDGLREPWRFIFIGSGNTGIMSGMQEQAPAYLILVIKEDRDPHKREEDFAAASCLMQNFYLLAQESKLHVRMTMNDWIYDRISAQRFGVHKDERVVAVLEMGYLEQTIMPVIAANSANLHFELL
ncbi:nitroreductase family protein [Paenibacillus sp. XY044]|uniref:nitroreductase family protein n=1 Tax=Paenibacillus sp. XY044 TaxID=2026089 RepID=UPI00211B5560|nr:nitroreductase family protein [Paenibacillus sp. XY044]